MSGPMLTGWVKRRTWQRWWLLAMQLSERICHTAIIVWGFTGGRRCSRPKRPRLGCRRDASSSLMGWMNRSAMPVRVGLRRIYRSG